MITPLDIESKEFKKSPYGYSSKEVDEFLSLVLESYEKLYKEKIELADKVSLLNEGLQYYKTMEETLKNTLIVAEKTAEETKSMAHKKAEQIEKEAEFRAQELINEAKKEVYAIHQKLESLISQYNSARLEIMQFYKTQLELANSKKIEITNEQGDPYE